MGLRRLRLRGGSAAGFGGRGWRSRLCRLVVVGVVAAGDGVDEDHEPDEDDIGDDRQKHPG